MSGSGGASGFASDGLKSWISGCMPATPMAITMSNTRFGFASNFGISEGVGRKAWCKPGRKYQESILIGYRDITMNESKITLESMTNRISARTRIVEVGALRLGVDGLVLADSKEAAEGEPVPGDDYVL